MFDEREASRFLQVLSRRRRLTELDAARALNSAARLLAGDPLSEGSGTHRHRVPLARPLA